MLTFEVFLTGMPDILIFTIARKRLQIYNTAFILEHSESVSHFHVFEIDSPILPRDVNYDETLFSKWAIPLRYT